MKTLVFPSSMRAFVFLLTLFGALRAPVYAQEPVTFLQQLRPEPEETFPQGAEFPQSTFMGSKVATDGKTALVEEDTFSLPSTPDRTGRVAVFTRNDAGTWERTGSIDEPSNTPVGHFGDTLAVSGDTALITGFRGMYVFHRQQGQWKRVQTLRIKEGWRFPDAALDSNYAFLAVTKDNQGVVYAYRVTESGRLHYLQRLDSGVDFDSYARDLSLSGDHLVVSAVDDDEGRGAAYIFERHGKRWKKQQKLVAIDGASGDSFSAGVAIAGNWLAVGAPGVDHGTGDCIGGVATGSVYVFRNANGTWSQKQEVTARDVLDFGAGCANAFGEQLVATGKWIGATSEAPAESGDEIDNWMLLRSAGHYALVANAGGGAGSISTAAGGKTLLVGVPFERGCAFSFCPGLVGVFRLNDPVP